MIYLLIFVLVIGIISLGLIGLIRALSNKNKVRTAIGIILSLTIIAIGIGSYYKSNLSTQSLKNVVLQANQEFQQFMKGLKAIIDTRQDLQRMMPKPSDFFK